MPAAASPVNTRSRILRALAVAIAAIAIAFAFTAAAPQRAYAYTSSKTDKSVGKVTGNRYGRTFYGNSVEDVMAIVDDMVSTRNNKLHEDEVTIDLLCDWNTKSYGRIKVPNGYTFHINLHGHMIDRGKALSYGDNKWYAEGSGEVIFVDGGTLYLDGGTENHQHKGFEYDDFWKYSEYGWSQCSIYGGLITGGACDDWHGAGGISLARDTSRAFINNTTIAGNITDQVDSSRYGHGAGIAVHGSKCTLELDNVQVVRNHAEGYGGGIYVRSTDCQLNIKNSLVAFNYSSKDGGGIYLDSKATLTIENSSVNQNQTADQGGGIYVNASGSVLNIKGTGDKYAEISGNKSVNGGGGIYTDGSDTTVNIEHSRVSGNGVSIFKDHGLKDGGGLYIDGNKSKVNITSSYLLSNSVTNGRGGAIYFYGNDGELNVTDSTINKNRAENWAGTSDAGRGGGIYHDGKRGKVTFKNSSLNGNEAYFNGGGLYNWYEGTEYEFINSTIADNEAYGDGGGVFFGSKATLTLDNSYIRGNHAGTKMSSANPINSTGAGGGVYNKSNGSKIIFKNGSSICGNELESNVKTANSGGAGVYSTDTLTLVSSDGTGTVKENTAEIGNGGGIWFKGALYLENIAITNNTTPGKGGGVYCTNTEYRAFEVARKVTISDNLNTDSKDSNLYLRKNQTVCSADGDRKLTADSKIGVRAEDYGGSGTRRVSGNQAVMRALGENYSSVFTSDDYKYSVSTDGNYVYIDPKNSGKYAVTVKIGAEKKELKDQADGSTVTLKTSEWLTFDEKSYNRDYGQNRSKYSTIDYWTVTDSVGERRVEVADGEASFALRGSDATAVPHILRRLGGVGVQIQETASWSELEGASDSTVSINFLNYRDRLWTRFYQYHEDWAKDHSVCHVVQAFDDDNQYIGEQTVYEWWDRDPTAGTKLIPKASESYPKADYNYGFDHIARGDAAAAAATVRRTGAEDVEKDGVVTGKKVTYQVTVDKSYFEGDGIQASAAGLLEFEALVSGTAENGLESQTLDDQVGGTKDPGYTTPTCTASVDADGNQVVTFTVTYPKTRAVVTFDAGEGSLPDGAAEKVTVGEDKKLSTLPVPTREGYVFDGWYIAGGDGAATETKVDTSTTFDSDTTVVAKWVKVKKDDEGEQTTVRYRMVIYLSQEDDLRTVDIGLAVFADPDATTAQITKPTDPTREGYTFKGWYKDAACSDGSEFTFDDHGVGSVEYAQDDLELYAKWEKDPVADHTVTFKDADGSVLGSRAVKDGEKCSWPQNPTKKGCEFAGWTLDGDSYDFGSPVTSDLTLVASWNEVTHTVTYETPADVSGQAATVSLMALLDDEDDDGTQAQDGDTGTVVDKVQVSDGDKAPELEPTRDGYRFAGWYTDAACAEGFEYDFDSETVTADITLYAKWVKTATITFDTGEGAEEVASLVVDAGTELSSADLPLAVRENYRFHGWLMDGGDSVDPTFEVDDDMTLHAHWVGDTVFVFLHGIYSEDEIYYDMKNYGDVLEGIEVNVDHADPVREGYSFGGWFIDEECTQAYEFGKDALTEDLDLYAKWVPGSCTVEFDSRGGSDVGGASLSGGDLLDEPEAPSRDGYVFKGWFTDKKCTETWDFSSPVIKSMTLYAGWAEAVAVTLDAAGGELPIEYPELTVEKGAPVGNLPVPRRGVTANDTASAEDAYVFLGWYTADGTKVDADSKFDSDVSLVARWKVNDGSDDSGTDTDADGTDKDADGSGSKDNLPRTGDDSGIAVAAVLVAGVILVLVGVIVKRRQH